GARERVGGLEDDDRSVEAGGGDAGRASGAEGRVHAAARVDEAGHAGDGVRVVMARAIVIAVLASAGCGAASPPVQPSADKGVIDTFRDFVAKTYPAGVVTLAADSNVSVTCEVTWDVEKRLTVITGDPYVGIVRAELRGADVAGSITAHFSHAADGWR